MSLEKNCPICEAGRLIETDYEDEIVYKNATGYLSGFQCSTCNACGAVITNSKQAKHNKLAVVNFKRNVDGLMTTHQIKDLLEKIGVSASEASAVIGGGPISFHKYINGSVTQSQAVDSILRAVSEKPEIYESLKAISKERARRIEQPYKIYIRLGEDSKIRDTRHVQKCASTSYSSAKLISEVFSIFRTA